MTRRSASQKPAAASLLSAALRPEVLLLDDADLVARPGHDGVDRGASEDPGARYRHRGDAQPGPGRPSLKTRPHVLLPGRGASLEYGPNRRLNELAVAPRHRALRDREDGVRPPRHQLPRRVQTKRSQESNTQMSKTTQGEIPVLKMKRRQPDRTEGSSSQESAACASLPCSAQIAPAATKLLKSGVETPSVDGDGDREHADVPAVQPLGRRLQREVLEHDHPDGSDRLGHGHLRGAEQHHQHRGLRRLLVPVGGRDQPAPQEHPARDLGSARWSTTSQGSPPTSSSRGAGAL